MDICAPTVACPNVIDRLSPNVWADAGAERFRGDEPHTTGEWLLQKLVGRHESIETLAVRGGSDEQVDIAIGASLIPDKRPEQREPVEVEFAYLLLRRGQAPNHVLARVRG